MILIIIDCISSIQKNPLVVDKVKDVQQQNLFGNNLKPERTA